MAPQGQRIENPVTGQTIIVRATGEETNGALFEAEGIFRPGGFAGALHVHPRQEERFVVTQGTAGFTLDGDQVRVGPGEEIMVPAGRAHTFWNAGPEEMRVRFAFRPALASTPRFYAFYFGLAQAGKAKKDGLPSLWQIALQAEEFADHVRLARPPWWLQRVLFALLRPLAHLLGYRPLHYAVSAPVPDVAALRAELAQTQAAFRAALAALSPAEWRTKGTGSAWSIGELVTHLTWSVEQLPREIAAARSGHGMFNMPAGVRDPLNLVYTRWLARRYTPASASARYAAAMAAVDAALGTVRADEWGCGARFYGERFYSVADLCHTPAQHLTEHRATIDQILGKRAAA